MYRYAVLWDVDGRESRPAGLAVETPDSVLVAASSAYGLPSHYTRSYHVLQPDSSEIVYTPNDVQYFDQVLIELSRMFAIANRDTIDVLDDAALRHLYTTKVLHQRISAVKADYGRMSRPGQHRAGALATKAAPARVAASARRRSRAAAA